MGWSCYCLLALIIYRVASVFLVQTYFVPDEYWQSLEVAHYLSYGYGYLTWEWKQEIRSCAYPIFIAVVFNIIPESAFLLRTIPRILQAILSAFGDYFTFKLTMELYGTSAAKWTLFCIVSSWFLFYCSTRTLANMAETSLIAMGLYYYPWTRMDRKRLKIAICQNIWLYMILMSIAVMVRPTAAIIWYPVHVWLLVRSKENAAPLLVKTICIGVIFASALMLIDYTCFGTLVVTPLRFFLFNWTYNIGTFYGVHPWHWYFSIGIPVVLTLNLFPFLVGVGMKKTRQMVYVIIFCVALLSHLSHKEFRFLLPVLPLCFSISGVGFSQLHSGRMKIWNFKLSRKLTWILSILTLVVNMIIGLYTGLVHQRGVLDAVNYLAETVTDESSILFLMPCHSTPYYSHIHKNITMRFLTCEPNFGGVSGYVDEASQFYNDPKAWVQSYIPDAENKNEMPSHIVMFDNLSDLISDLINVDYTLCFDVKHADISQGRVGKYVYIYCKK